MTKGQIVRRYLAHLGIILCHLSIVGVIFIISSFMVGLLSIMFFLGGLCLIVITLGTIFLFIPDYWSKLIGVSDLTGNFMTASIELMPTVAVITAVSCIASIVLTALDTKWEKAKTRLIISSVMAGVVIFFIVAILIGIIGGAGK